MEKFDSFEPNLKQNQKYQPPENRDTLDVQAISTSKLIENSLSQPELVNTLAQNIHNDPQLQKRLDLENTEPLEIQIKLKNAIEKLTYMAEDLTMMAELIAIILVNPKSLIKDYKKFGLVLAQNDAILKNIDAKLDGLKSDENKLKVVAGYLGKMISNSNPAKPALSAITYLTKLTGIVSEEEYSQMQSNTEIMDEPTLNSWIIYQVIKNDPALAQSIYEFATTAYSNHEEQKTKKAS